MYVSSNPKGLSYSSSKGSDTFVGNAISKQLYREVLLDIKGQYMKESNTLVGNVAKWPSIKFKGKSCST